MDLNILLQMLYVPSQQNPTNAPSRRLHTHVRSGLYTHIGDLEWSTTEVRGWKGPLMWSDGSRFQRRVWKAGASSPPFHAIPLLPLLNLLAHDLTRFSKVMQCPYVFPPNILDGPVLRFLQSYRQSCTIWSWIQRKYWWSLLQRFSTNVRKLAGAGDSQTFSLPSKEGWSGESGIPGDVGAF